MLKLAAKSPVLSLAGAIDAGTHQNVLWCFPYHIPAWLDQVGCDMPGPLHIQSSSYHALCKKGLHTHTLTSLQVSKHMRRTRSKCMFLLWNILRRLRNIVKTMQLQLNRSLENLKTNSWGHSSSTFIIKSHKLTHTHGPKIHLKYCWPKLSAGFDDTFVSSKHPLYSD